MEKVEAIAGANKLKVNLDGRDLPSLAKLLKQRKGSLLGYLVVTKNKLVEEKGHKRGPTRRRSKCAQLR